MSLVMIRSYIFPELQMFEPDSERRKVYLRALRTNGNNPRIVLGALTLCIVVSFACYFGRSVLPLLSDSLSVYAWELIGGASGGALGGIIFLSWIRATVRKALRRELAIRGVPICVNCGYDLRGSVEKRCPECGMAFEPLRPAEAMEK